LNDQILALYDITGIQRYIFQTSKLKDIIGASALVGNALEEKIMETLGKTEFKKSKLYIGGGNAIFSFTDRSKWKEFNTKFSKKLLLEIPGLSFVTVCNEKGEDNNEISTRIKNLFTDLAKKKSLGGDDCSITTLPPMAQSAPERIPIVFIETDVIDKGDYSYAAWKKREKGKNVTEKSIEPIEFDCIAKKPEHLDNAERIMAVVHIDGNQMGQWFMKECEKAATIEDIEASSQKVDRAFNDAFNEMWNCVPEKHRRKIYIAGDDITYVCHGIYALSSAINFLRALDTFCKQDEQLHEISASAGIAYVKPHFPFYKAYEIAENCCKEAKRKAREQNDSGGWVNFEIVRGSQNEELLKVKGKRPYCVTGQSRQNDVAKLLKWLDIINDEAGARSKWKALRNEYLMGNMASVKSLMESRGMIPPKDVNEELVAFDALDLMDVEVLPFENISSEGGM